MSPVSPADIKRQVLIQGIDVAPDGSFAVYGRRTVEDGKYASRLWRVGFERGARPERLTNGPSDAGPRISPDGRSLLFVGARGDDPPAPWILPLAGGEPARVAEFPGPTAFAEWSADGTQVLVLASSGDQRFVVGDAASPVARRITDLTWRLDGLGIRDQYMSAWVVPASGGKPTRLTSGHETFGAFWTPDGERIGFLADRTDGAALIEEPRAWAVSTSGTGRPRELPGPRTVTAAAWSPDGRTLALLGSDEPEPAGWAVEKLYVAERGTVRQLAAELDRPMRNQTIADLLDFSSVFNPTLRWLDDSSLLTIVGDRGCAHPYRFRLDGSYERLAGGPIITTGAASGGGRLAIVATDGGRPPEVYAVENGELRALTRDGSRWLGARRIDPEPVELPRRGSSPAVDAWLVRARSGRGRRPLVLTIHGGPFGAYGPTPSLPYLALADAGIHVLYANPRGSTGYGEVFARELEGAWGETDAPDLLRCIDWAVRGGNRRPAPYRRDGHLLRRVHDQLAARPPPQPLRRRDQREPRNESRLLLRHLRLRLVRDALGSRGPQPAGRLGAAPTLLAGDRAPALPGTGDVHPRRRRPSVPARADRARVRDAAHARTARRDGALPGGVARREHPRASRPTRRPDAAHRQLLRRASVGGCCGPRQTCALAISHSCG